MKDFKDFSIDQIQQIAQQAADEARLKTLQSGLEVAGQVLETGELYLERLDESGKIVRRTMSADDAASINTKEHNPFN